MTALAQTGRSVALASALMLVVQGTWITAAYAQKANDAWPSRPLRLLIPASPGGGADTLARVMASRLTERFGQPVVIDNRAGASGAIAMELTARAAPDGYTLILTQSTSAVIAPAINDKLPYDTLRDLAPASR